MADAPLWRQVFDRVERTIGERLEQGVQTDEFADVAALLAKLQLEFRRRLDTLLARNLRRFNLPAHTEVAALSLQIGHLERRVRELSKQLADAERLSETATGRSPSTRTPPNRTVTRLDTGTSTRSRTSG